jgi:hypothetical protein
MYLYIFAEVIFIPGGIYCKYTLLAQSLAVILYIKVMALARLFYVKIEPQILQFG